jgi:FkbM family methyltransferase
MHVLAHPPVADHDGARLLVEGTWRLMLRLPVKSLHRSMKRVGERLFAAAGYSVIPTWRLATYPQATYLRRLFDLARVTCVIDVGANAGQFYDFLRTAVGFNGWIVSFEPVPHHARALRERAVSESHWHCEECALGARSGEAEFKVMSNTQFSSFLDPDHSAVGLFESLNRVEQRISVRMDTLDMAMARLPSEIDKARIYLKLDTQGFDLEVLKGASATLTHVVALQTEASVKQIYVGMPDYKAVIGSVEALGFELSAIFPNNTGHFPVLVEFDCHLVSRTLARTPGTL